MGSPASERCSICLSELLRPQGGVDAEHDGELATSACGHVFHAPCIDRCLAATQPRCPVCRSEDVSVLHYVRLGAVVRLDREPVLTQVAPAAAAGQGAVAAAAAGQGAVPELQQQLTAVQRRLRSLEAENDALQQKLRCLRPAVRVSGKPTYAHRDALKAAMRGAGGDPQWVPSQREWVSAFPTEAARDVCSGELVRAAEGRGLYARLELRGKVAVVELFEGAAAVTARQLDGSRPATHAELKEQNGLLRRQLRQLRVRLLSLQSVTAANAQRAALKRPRSPSVSPPPPLSPRSDSASDGGRTVVDPAAQPPAHPASPPPAPPVPPLPSPLVPSSTDESSDEESEASSFDRAIGAEDFHKEDLLFRRRLLRDICDDDGGDLPQRLAMQASEVKPWARRLLGIRPLYPRSFSRDDLGRLLRYCGDSRPPKNWFDADLRLIQQREQRCPPAKAAGSRPLFNPLG